MSVARVSWLPVTSLPPMSTNQMWLAWLTGLSSSHWQLTLLCVHRDVGKMPPESCLSSFCLCFFNLLFTFRIAYFAAPLCPSVCSHVSPFFLFLSSCITVNTLTDHSPVIAVVNVSSMVPSVSFILLCQHLTYLFLFPHIQSLSHYPTIVAVYTMADSVSFHNLYG